jgi:pimeloyl-ACP methyl ester carboxylesterase
MQLSPPDDGVGLVATNGIVMHVEIRGSGPAVVLVHGFPDLGLGWHHQIPVLADAGYRVIVPDMRGYGRTSAPVQVDAYRIDRLVDDLLGLLDCLGETEAVFVGHDWGASVVWHVAAAHPERVRGAVGLSVPFAAPAPSPPLEILRRRLGDDFYMAWFQAVGPADAALRSDVTRTLASAFTGGDNMLTWRAGTDVPPSWVTAADFEVYVRTFSDTGFSGGLSYYRNIDDNWRLARRLGLKAILPPAMFVVGSADPLAAFMPIRESSYADLRSSVVLNGAGHWLHQERPEEVTRLLLAFLDALS